jgi:hypothetical protein
MGVWQGIYEAHLGIVERKDREKELQQAREDRQRERQEDQDFALNQYKMQVLDRRKDAFYGLLAERAQDSANTSEDVAFAQAFYGRLEGLAEDDPKVVALKSNPMFAAEAERQLQAIEQDPKRADAGITFRGNSVLEVVLPPPVGGGVPETPVIDMESFNFADDAEYYDMLNTLSRKPAKPTVMISPSAFRTNDPKVLEEARNQFDRVVIEAAVNTRDALGEETSEWSQLNNLIENYDKEDSASRARLRQRFGNVAMAELLQSNSPFIQRVEDIPEFQPFLRPADDILQLREIIADPLAPVEQKEEARSLLVQRFGVTY